MSIPIGVTGGEVAALAAWATSLHADHFIVERRAHYGDPDRLWQVELHAHGRLAGTLGWGRGYVVDIDVHGDVPALEPSGIAHGDIIPAADVHAACARAHGLPAAATSAPGGERP